MDFDIVLVSETKIEIVEPDSAEIWASQAAQSANEAETSANEAEAHKDEALAQASNSATSAAAALASATNAANQVALAATQASNSATSAAASEASRLAAVAQVALATTQANNAAASAAAAMASENAAAAAQNSVALLYDNFDDRYLGAKSAPPTLDNDGNALVVGALYFDTTVNEWRIWNGVAWQVAPFTIPGALLDVNNLADVINKAAARQNLGLEIGANVQAYSETLAAIAALSTTAFGRSLLTLLNADALALLTRTQLDARYVQPAQATPTNASWYGFRDTVSGELILETVGPFEPTNLSVDTWNMRYEDGALAFAYLIGLNINAGASNAGVTYSYEVTPDATAPTVMVWGFRDANGELTLETINPLSGEVTPSPNWNMYYTNGQLAYGAQSIFEIVPVAAADIVLNY